VNREKSTAEGRENVLTERIIGAAIEVHRHLGPGLLESAYEECLCHELHSQGISFRRQVPLPVNYKGLQLDCAYKIDILVEDTAIVELKAVDSFAPVHHSQLLTYLKLANKPVGLLINFHVAVLKSGLKRIVNRYVGPSVAETEGDSPRISQRLRDSAFRNIRTPEVVR
jgi:GxxExxY protein